MSDERRELADYIERQPAGYGLTPSSISLPVDSWHLILAALRSPSREEVLREVLDHFVMLGRQHFIAWLDAEYAAIKNRDSQASIVQVLPLAPQPPTVTTSTHKPGDPAVYAGARVCTYRKGGTK